MKRGREILMLALGASLLLALFAASVVLPLKRTLTLFPDSLPADSCSSAKLVWSQTNIYGSPVPYFPQTIRVAVVKGADRVKLLGSTSRTNGPAYLEMGLRAKGDSGEVIITIDEGSHQSRRRLNILARRGDNDGDGMPDQIELNDAADRNAFRQWFVAIAEAQFYRPDSRWAKIHHDCAGLVRFAYKEALRKHDEEWLSSIPYLHHSTFDDVRRYNFPNVPVIGDRLFRVRAGRLGSPGDVERDFSASASARALWEYNTVFVSKDLKNALPGDLLFFRDPDRQPEPMHSMILLDRFDRADGPRVVYHTGRLADDDPGEVRLVKLAALSAHKDDRWRVRPDNPYFEGFYRFKIIAGARLNMPFFEDGHH